MNEYYAERPVKVQVWGRSCVISVYQRSKSVWIASGDYLGQPIEVKGASASAAVNHWIETARYRGN
jgi:hypothetical protein